VETTIGTNTWNYFNRLTCTLLLVLGLLGIFVPASQAATGAFTFSTATASVNEGAGKVNITINRVGGSTGAASVSFRTNPISATAGSDFVNTPLTVLNFAHRERQKVVSVNIINDTVVEPAETFKVLLSNPTYGTTLGKISSSVITIQDNDIAPVNSAVDTMAPTVTLTSPANASTFTSAQTVTIVAAASDNVGVSKVELYNGATLVATDTTSPYSFAWAITSANNGNHSLTAKAYDAAGNSKVSTAVTVTVNIPVQNLSAPTVSLTSPSAGTTFTSAQTVRIAAATSSTGVSKIDFYNGNTLLKNDTTSPYYFDWAISSANNGSHNLSAKAYDAAGNVTNTTTVAININIAVAAPAYDSSTRTPLSLRIDQSFTVDKLPTDARLWYKRFLAGMQNTSQSPDATALAQSNNVYDYGRGLNTHITTILQMLRVTGDQRLLDEVDRLAQLMRAKLKDSSILTVGGSTYQADGYLNWLYLRDNEYYGTDVHQMDDMLAHTLAASMAYAFHVNRDLDPRYAERAQFWTNYLKNHFEAKWRKRTRISTGFPFLEKKLSHVYTQFVRYHLYMAKLTGEKAYQDEALRMAEVLKQQFKSISTPIGTGTMWDHGMPTIGGSVHGPQPVNYGRYTVQAAADLAAEGFSLFAQAGFMERMAVTLDNKVLGTSTSAYAGYIDGSDPGGTSLSQYVVSPWPMLGRWDSSGKVRKETERLYFKIESSPARPQRIYLPAGMVYILTR